MHLVVAADDLIDHLLCPLEEEWLQGKPHGSVINRVKELRKAVVPDMIQGRDADDSDRLPIGQPELDRRWRQLQDMHLAQALSLFPREYVSSFPTVDRILETVERMAENLIIALEPVQEKRRYYENNQNIVDDVTIQGRKKASIVAKSTMEAVRSAIKI